MHQFGSFLKVIAKIDILALTKTKQCFS